MKLLFLFLFFSNTVFAEESFFDFLNDLEAKFEVTKEVLCDPAYYENQKKDEALFQECAQSLCGSPKDVAPAALSNNTFAKLVDMKELKKYDDFVPKLREKIAKTRKYFSKVAQKLSDADKVVDNVQGYELSMMEQGVYGQYVSFEIDKSLPMNKRLKAIVKKTENKTLQEGIDDYAKRKIDLTLSSPSEMLTLGFYTEKEKIEKLHELYNKYKSIPRDDIYVEDEQDGYSEDDSLNEFYNASLADPSDQFLMTKIFATLEQSILDAQWASGNAQPSFEEKACVNSKKCMDGIKTFIKKIDLSKVKREMTKYLSRKDLEENIISDCKANYASTLLKSERNENFLELTKKMKKGFSEKALKGMSAETRKDFDHYLDNKLGISHQFSKESENATFENNIEYEEYDYEGEVNDALAISHLINMSNSNQRSYNPIPYFMICPQGSPYLVWDMFTPKGDQMFIDVGSTDIDFDKDTIVSSPFTCNHFDYGEGILAHEIGHALSNNFSKGELSEHSKGTFLKLRKCANENYPFYDLDKITHGTGVFPEDKFRTEEDTADLIAYSYLGNVAKGGKLFSCSLLDISRNGEKFEHLEIDNIGKLDSHSTGFFRLLKEATFRNAQMGKACKDVMNKYKYYGFKKCE